MSFTISQMMLITSGLNIVGVIVIITIAKLYQIAIKKFKAGNKRFLIYLIVSDIALDILTASFMVSHHSFFMSFLYAMGHPRP